LAKKFIDAQDLHPDDVITYRDLRQTPVPHVTEDWIAASFTAPEALTSEMAELLKFSDELVDEFWQPIDVFSVCQCTTSAFRPISRPTLIPCGSPMRRMVKSHGKVLFITEALNASSRRMG